MTRTMEYPVLHACISNFADKDLPENHGKLLFMGPHLPLLNEHVYVKMNGLGWGWVRAYGISWIEDDYAWISLFINFDNPPDWYVKQNNENVLGMIVGAEIDWSITAGGEFPIAEA